MSEKRTEADASGRWSEALSDLADGRASVQQVRALGLAWKDQPELRREWHAIHLIGDSLRSAELANETRPAADFLAAVRARLSQEPLPIRPRRWQAWFAPIGVAASFVLVALAVPGLQSILLPNRGGERLALQASGSGAAIAGSTLTGGQPSFSQSLVEPTVRAVSLIPVLNDAAVAPFELAVPSTATAASGAVMTSSAAAR